MDRTCCDFCGDTVDCDRDIQMSCGHYSHVACVNNIIETCDVVDCNQCSRKVNKGKSAGEEFINTIAVIAIGSFITKVMFEALKSNPQ